MSRDSFNQALDAVHYSFHEARHLGESWVSTEHLLLGLIRTDDNAACYILQQMGISLLRIRTEIERQRCRSSIDTLLVEMTPRLKRVIEMANEERRLLDQRNLGPEHLLLALLREGEGLAARVLVKQGADLDAMRELVNKLPQDPAPWWKHYRDHGRRFAEAFHSLPPMQQEHTQQEGLPLRQLPTAMQDAIAYRVSPFLTPDISFLDESGSVQVQIAPSNTVHGANNTTTYTVTTQAIFIITFRG
jgi:ATP-dependent Clp protease ATP-binding subunit ClpA